MKKVYYATTNNAKVLSLRRRLEHLPIEIEQVQLELPEPRSDDVEEIALSKVNKAYEQLKKPVITLDAGFYIHSLNGFPKAFVNFTLSTIGIEGILKLVDGKERESEFRECLCYRDGITTVPFLATIEGTLATAPRGKIQSYHWSRLASIFIPQGEQKTLAEMTYGEYVTWTKKRDNLQSAAKKFADWLEEKKKSELQRI